jgi:hypothetical protein
VRLDNLRIRRADDRVVPLWSDKRDTRAVKIETGPLFTDVQVRAVPSL